MTTAASPHLEAVLKRDRAVVLASLGALTVLAWLYLIDMALAMPAKGLGESLTGMAPVVWDAGHFLAMFVMWAIMMLGMMLPSAAPMILLYALVARRGRPEHAPYFSVGLFALGYLVVWTGFGLLATTAQWGLSAAALLSPAMVSTSPILGSLLFLTAGVYQLTPVKGACLRHCRSPISFLAHAHRPGRRGALVMGLHHGAYCVGCCWVLMALLFVLGVMNLLWVAAIAGLVLLEKVLPRGPAVARASAGAMVAAGALLLASA